MMTRHLLSRLLPIALLAWASALFSQDLIVTGSETISGTATYDHVTVQACGVLTVDGVLNVNQNMEVESIFCILCQVIFKNAYL